MASHVLPFEKPVVELVARVRELRALAENDRKFEGELRRLEEKCGRLTRELFADLTPWQKVQLSRHPNRPYTLDYFGFLFEDFVELLNRRVFFWAGQEHGPAGPAKTYGGNHFETYSSERPVILRINFMSLMSANEGQQPLFCQYNSGAPRCSRGHHAPRGPNTFLHPAMFPKSAAGVAEVTFADQVGLPDDTMVASQFGTQWKPL